MAKKRKKRKKYGKVIALYTVLILLAVCGLIYLIKQDLFSGNPLEKVQKEVNRTATKTAIEQIVQKQTGEKVDIDQLRNNMSDEDAKEFDNIVDKYATTENVEKAAEIAVSGDKEAAQEFISQNVDMNDMDTVQELYEKYKDQIPEGTIPEQ